MPTLRRAAVLGLLTLVGVVSATSAARAQAQPPPATSPPPTGDATGAPPDAAPAPPSAGAAPVTPLPSTLAPEPAPAPPLQLTEQRTQYGAPAPQPEPFYRQWWFWGAVGVVAATVAIILVWNLGSNDSGPPSTTLGNMHAF